MYNFAICDDNENDLLEIKGLLIEFLNNVKINDYVIDTFITGQSLIESTKTYNLIFLDILLADTNGINIAKHFLDLRQEQNIIFISSSIAYSKEGYRVKALRYLTKPIDKEELFFDLSNVLKKIIEDSLFVYDEKVKKLKLFYKNIMYIEVLGRDTYIYYNGEKKISKKQLKVWEEQLKNNHFVRSHNSYLVNLAYVFDIKNNRIILKNSSTVPLSRTYKAIFKESFFDYLGDNS